MHDLSVRLGGIGRGCTFAATKMKRLRQQGAAFNFFSPLIMAHSEKESSADAARAEKLNANYRLLRKTHSGDIELPKSSFADWCKPSHEPSAAGVWEDGQRVYDILCHGDTMTIIEHNRK